MTKVVYTIGALEVYERSETTYKGVGGSVWRTKQAVLDYYKHSDGLVTLHGQRVPAGIYEVHLPNGWDEDTADEYEQGEWRPLLVKARLGNRIE